MVFLFTATANADLTDGLVVYYSFNGNAIDESGNGDNGTVLGATLTEDKPGNVDGAYRFDRTGYIEIPANTFLLNITYLLP